jgi:serine phosphatase RsbU (regulator of sigma subunit)/anti-sigma regulatory factor (Ser/Thr protein kinase)
MPAHASRPPRRNTSRRCAVRSWRIAIPSDPHYLPWLQAWLPACADNAGSSLSRQGLWRATLVLIEAVTNAIFHAHTSDPTKWITIVLTLKQHAMTLTIEDSGPPFRWRPTCNPDMAVAHGRGLYLMESFCQRVTLKRIRGGNALTLYLEDAPPDAVADVPFEEQALAALHRLSRAIVEAPHLEGVCQTLLQELIRIIPVGSASIMQYHADDATLRVVASIGMTREVAQRIRIPVGEGISGRVFTSSQPILIEDVRSHPEASHRRRYQSQSVMAVPVTSLALQVEGQPLGVINMTDKRDGTAFTAQDLALLKTLANQAAAYIHICQLAERVAAGQRLEQEMALAREIQQGFLPQQSMRIPGLKVAGRCLPSAKIGGDYYDFFLEPGDAPGAVIADVAGHHVGAALTMAGVRRVLHVEMGREGSSLEAVMRSLNQQLFDDLARAEQFVSAVLVRFARQTHQLEYVVAGHPSPLLWRSGAMQTLQGSAGGVLGVGREDAFPVAAQSMDPGDLLFLYTDGVTGVEDARGRAFGVERLQRTVDAHAHAGSRAVVAGVEVALRTFANTKSFADDVTMVALQVQ